MNEKQNNNQNNRKDDNKNKKSLRGLLVLLGWAVVLTIVFNYLSDYTREANAAATTHEIPYSEFIDLVEEGQVEEVIFTDGMLKITTTDGYIYKDEDGKEYGENFTLFTMQMGSYSEGLLALLDEYDVTYTNPYVPEMSPILEFMISYILPTIMMLGVFLLFMNLMARRGGGIGGMGSVGKSNAKVYME